MIPPHGRRGTVRLAWAMLWVALLAASVSTAATPAATTQRFLSGPEGWTARDPTMQLRAEDAKGLPTPGRALRIRGRSTAGWNFAASARLPLQPGAQYRLSAWLRVDALSEGARAPFFKCEFLRGATAAGARVNSERYDLARRGAWQELAAEFLVPEGVTAGYLALEKGDEAPVEIDALVAGVSLAPLAHAPAAAARAPVPRSEARPRLLLDAARLEALRGEIATSRGDEWRAVLAIAERLAATSPPAFRAEPRSGEVGQLWQRDVGNSLPYLAIASVLDGAPRYRDALNRWSRAAASYPTWGLGADDGRGLEAGHLMFGLAATYDWAGGLLPEATRAQIRDVLVRRGGALYRSAASGYAGLTEPLLKNTMWVPLAGLAAAAIALEGEAADTGAWLDLVADRMRKVAEALPPDGTSAEGIGYWGYGVEYLLKTLVPLRDLRSLDLLGRPFWRNAAAYRLYVSIPTGAWTRRLAVVDIGDSPRSNWYGPDYTLRALATLNDDPHARWLADRIAAAHAGGDESLWMGLVLGRPGPASAPGDLPTLRHFADLDLVSARSGWSGDESLVVFKCGPPAGHAATARYGVDVGASHAHPDAGHFVVFGDGRWLIRDDGYGPKRTSQHNTLLIDGQGQIGEGGPWLDGSPWARARRVPRVLRAESTPAFDRMSGDLAPAYPAATGLQRATRHLFFVRPATLLVLDDVEASESRTLELRFHPEPVLRPDGDDFVEAGADGRLRIAPLTPEGVHTSFEIERAAGPEQGDDGKLGTLRLRTQAAQWRNAVAIAWGDTAKDAVQLVREGDRWTFQGSDWTLAYDWTADQATFSRR